MDELAAEVTHDTMPERFPNRVPPAIEWGWKYEGYAIAGYELDSGLDVVRPPFAVHPDIPQVGCTSDFLAPGINGEVKCPHDPANHMFVVANRQIPPQYFPQVQCQMWVHGLELTHFVSYDPRHPDWRSRSAVVPIARDEAYIRVMAERVAKFLDIFNAGQRPNTGRPQQLAIKRYF
jgi:hypothetical protein